LTPTEAQVAGLAATGSSNRVEANLTRIYAKLGVRSRTELAAAVAGSIEQGRPSEPSRPSERWEGSPYRREPGWSGPGVQAICGIGCCRAGALIAPAVLASRNRHAPGSTRLFGIAVLETIALLVA
jgi:anti-sigma factor RsiW